MKELCPTCGGRGSIADPKCYGIIMGYCGPNGETMPMVLCQTCNGTGWIYKNKEVQTQFVCMICKEKYDIGIDPLPIIGKADGCCRIGSLIEPNE